MAAIRKDAGRHGRAVVAAEAGGHDPDLRDLEERFEVKDPRDGSQNSLVAGRGNLRCLVMVGRVHDIALSLSVPVAGLSTVNPETNMQVIANPQLPWSWKLFQSIIAL
jgi:hypothetical protein